MKKMNSSWGLLGVLLLTTSCLFGTVPGLQASQEPGSTGMKRCGDGVCDGPENSQTCAADCGVPETEQGAEEGEAPDLTASVFPDEYRVENPATGNELYVHIVLPEGRAGPYPAVVLVPGGIGDGEGFRLPGGLSERLAGVGYAAVTFDADGRGQSMGVEDYNGFAQQDGLAAVIEFAAALPQVDGESLGLVSYSYGITMASGALARHPDLPILFLIDWEGPANRMDTTSGCEPDSESRIDFQPCTDDSFWSEREAETYAAQIPVPYQRLQTERDHVQPDLSHALDMVNAAVEGAAPWVRLNDLPPDQLFDQSDPPAMIAEDDPRPLERLILEYVRDLFSRFE